MTLTFELDLGRANVDKLASYLVQRSSNSEVIVQTQTHKHVWLTAAPGPLKWSVKIIWCQKHQPPQFILQLLSLSQYYEHNLRCLLVHLRQR